MRKSCFLFLLFLVSAAQSQVQYSTTIYPFKAILKPIVEERAKVYNILPAGSSPHTYQLRPSDMRQVESSTALILGGKNLDEWAYRLPQSNRIEFIKIVPKNYLLTIDIEPGDKEMHNYDRNVHQHGSGTDPHFWTDPLTVKAVLPALTDSLCRFDAAGCSIYQKNTAQFAEKLDSLYQEINRMLKPVRGKAVVLTHPFFQYFLNRFGLKIVGIIETVAAVEPTPQEIKTLIHLIEQNHVKVIFSHPQLPDRSAKIVAESTGARVFQLDPIGGVPGRQTYQEILLYNTSVILEAFHE